MKVKNATLLGIAVISHASISAQIQKGFHYRIPRGETVTYVEDRRSPVTVPKVVRSASGLKAGIKQKGDTLIIDFWGITDDPFSGDPTAVNSTQSLTYGFYYISLPQRRNNSDIDTYRTFKYATWEVGLTTIPYKFRFGKTTSKDTIRNDVSTAVNAGIYIGRKWGSTLFYIDKDKSKNRLSFTAAAFFNATSIDLSEKTTLKKVKYESKELGLGVGVGFMLSIGDINAGVLTGIDIPISGESEKWNYANRPWLGFGLGYKLGIFGEK